MAWCHYLNLEPLALELAQEHIDKMTNRNYMDKYLDIDGTEPCPDYEAFLNNFKHGFMALTMLCCYYESSLNTFLREGLGFDFSSKQKVPGFDEKLEIIFENKPKERNAIKGNSLWRDWNEVIKMRNSLMHYRNNSAGIMSSYSPIHSWEINDKKIDKYFTKSNFERISANAQWITNQLAAVVGLTVNPEPTTFGGDGRCGNGSYYCTLEEAASIRKY
jgi:hypothetical protein